jgi:AcrR family transcriptional regulator
VTDTRPSRPTRRARQAEQTRREILRAARDLFALQGYARTSVKEVAERAGVSAQTVYDSVGSKRALVVQLNDQIDEEAGVRAIADAAHGETDPMAVLAVAPRIIRSILDHCGDIVRAAATGAPSETELGALFTEGELRHRDGCRRIVRRLAELGALRPDRTTEEAVDSLAALTGVAYGLVLIDHLGWSTERIESWMLETCADVLLNPR